MTMNTSDRLTIDLAPLRDKTVFLATPMYGGNANANYVSSVLALQRMCGAADIGFTHYFMSNESLITRARNGLVWAFRNHVAATHLLFVDADIDFDAKDILAMLHFDKDVIALPYPKKRINWEVIVSAVAANPGITRHELEQLVGDYVFSPIGGDAQGGPVIEVAEAGTGLMLIKRSLFDRWDQHYPDDTYLSDDSVGSHTGQRRRIGSYFTTGVVDDRYLSEDYMFCKKWRDMGGHVWLYPWAHTRHFGTYGFTGSIATLVQNVLSRQDSAR